MTVRYLSEDELIAINQNIIIRAGEGSIAVLDRNGLNSIINQLKIEFFGEEAYPTIWLKAAYLLQKITKKHVFMDGNKRTAYMATVMFLQFNHFKLILAPEQVKNLMIQATISPDTNEEMLKIMMFIKAHSTSF